MKINLAAKFLRDPKLTIKFEPKIFKLFLTQNNIEMNYRDFKNGTMEGPLFLRDRSTKYKVQNSESLGYGTLYRGEELSKEISPSNFFTEQNLKTWVEKNKLIEGTILYDKNKKIVKSEINLDHVEFWTLWLKGLPLMEKVGDKKNLDEGWTYINPRNRKSGKSPKEYEVAAVAEWLSGLLQYLPLEERKELAASIIDIHKPSK